MLKRLLIFFLIGIVTSILGIFFILIRLRKEKIIDKTKTVYIDRTDHGFQLIRNKNLFVIQGASGNSHLKELADIGGNTIRLYDTINLANYLNEAQKNGLAVIVDIPIPGYNKNYNAYEDENHNKLLKQKIKSLITEHKNHPALLMWNLGNEIGYPFVFWENSFMRNFNEIIEIIHQLDPNHPVGTAIPSSSKKQTLSIYYHSPKIDLVSYNIFGNIKNLTSEISNLSYFTGSKPYYLSEWGNDGPWEHTFTSWDAPIEPTSTKKIEQLTIRYKNISNNIQKGCLGSLVFFWGQKQESTHTWFSLFGDNNSKSEIIPELESIWTASNYNRNKIDLDYMLVDNQSSLKNIVFSPSEKKIAEIVFSTPKKDSLNIKWEIYPEAWNYRRWGYGDMEIKPKKVITRFEDFAKHKTLFVTPTKEGPYRIFAYIYDQDGYYATTNIPFYVLNDKSKPYEASK
ncbi:glycoside hydrolase family 2 TIM barrel-domain containing protein [Sediminicola arcticus]|jgi:hypothetical protein|uniref:Glycoside hydrolase family 2 TIM barrel-domain containing protein n=1 Tax=Sediminicola arcticus TaxID=1574308 RepID=A0ABV2SRR6_9FLAO